MPKYSVNLEMTDYYTVEVEAHDAEEAMESARETLCQLADPVTSEHHTNCSGFEACSYVEIAQ